MASSLVSGHAPFVGDPGVVLVDEPLVLFGVLGCQKGTPALGVDDVGAFEALVEIVHDLEARVSLAGVLAPLLDDVGHELELGRVHESQVHTETGKQEHEALGDADRLGVARRRAPS